jgi:hypothetical protein
MSDLGMSDEEFLKQPIPDDTPPEPQNEPVDDVDEEEVVSEQEEPEEAPEDTEEPTEALEDTTTEEQDDGLQEEEKETNEVKDTSTAVNYEEAYKSLLAPFKANGKEMAVDSIEDARQLMQMGANYNKKMAMLKPNLKMVKTLEKNSITEDDLNYLIDLKNKSPEAIQKLLKDSGVDPLDIDTSSEVNYTPKSYVPNDKEVELDGILEEIQETESFNTTVDIIGNKWDKQSKQVVVDNPQLIKVINDHVSNGIYNQIVGVVERERMLGRLIGLSDIEAYKQVGDALNAQGAFNSLSKGKPSVEVPNNKVDPRLAERKKAASSTKSKPVVNKQLRDNPLSMSDEEFEKVMPKYI